MSIKKYIGRSKSEENTKEVYISFGSILSTDMCESASIEADRRMNAVDDSLLAQRYANSAMMY